jgi:putative inorganic carbon (hco3(-)) transporter
MALRFWGQRILLFTFFIYMMLFGATWLSVGDPLFQQATLMFFGVIALIWFVYRIQAKWLWASSPFDGLWLGWGIVMLLSIVANPETWRRSLEASWYMLFYLAVWYLFSDILANGKNRRGFIFAFVIGGIVQLFIILQIEILASLSKGAIERVTGTLENPNFLASMLIILIPFLGVLALNTRSRLAKVVFGISFGLAIVTQVLTFSRGGWLGTLASFGMIGILYLAHKKMLSVSALKVWWQALSKRIQAFVSVILFSGVLGGVGFTVFLVSSLSIAGRGASLRTTLWEGAWRMFEASPIIGKGLFTYGYYLPNVWSIPPEEGHSHPHNLPLLILGEFGILGFLMLIVTLGVVYWLLWQHWKTVSNTDKPFLMASIGVLAGLGVHHLFDTTLMMPGIALMCLFVLALTIPLTPQSTLAHWLSVFKTLSVPLLLLGLLGVGFWQSSLNARYVYAVDAKIADSERVVVLDELVSQDPYNFAYRVYQGYFWGRIAHTADEPLALASAIEAYEVATQINPLYAPPWANLAALYWQAGRPEAAQNAIAQAVALAPRWQWFKRQQAIYLGQATYLTAIPPETSYTRSIILNQFLRLGRLVQFIPQVGRGQ